MIKVHGCDVEWIDFPSGEPHCRVTPQQGRNHITVEFSYECPCLSDQIMKLMLLADAIRGRGLILYNIIFDYLPFARQDRRAVDGDAHALKVFANMVNSLKPEIITLVDPHSDVAAALFEPVHTLHIMPQHEVLRPYFEKRDSTKPFYLVSPDHGASKKIFKLAALVKPKQVLECWKIRNPYNGEITDISLPKTETYETSDELIIVDDICDGGRTFIGLAKELRSMWSDCKITLVVSHGLFTHGMAGLKEQIDEIWVRGTRIA